MKWKQITFLYMYQQNPIVYITAITRDYLIISVRHVTRIQENYNIEANFPAVLAARAFQLTVK